MCICVHVWIGTCACQGACGICVSLCVYVNGHICVYSIWILPMAIGDRLSHDSGTWNCWREYELSITLELRLQNPCLECFLPPWLIAAGLDLLTIPGGVSSQAQTCSRAGGRKLSSPCLLWHSWNLAGKKKSVLLKRTDSVGLRQSRSASPSRSSPGTSSCVTLSFVLKLLSTFRCIAFPLPANNPEALPFFSGFCEMWSFKQHDG